MATGTVRLHRVLRASPERVTMKTTVSLRAVSPGTELNIVQEGIPEAISVEACHLGWQESLVLLAKLVESEIRE